MQWVRRKSVLQTPSYPNVQGFRLRTEQYLREPQAGPLSGVCDEQTLSGHLEMNLHVSECVTARGHLGDSLGTE